MEAPMSNCYFCGEKITDENRTEEHIILNAIGGRLTSYDLICKKCNSKFGFDADDKLAKKYNFFANILMLKRHRGTPQPIIMDRQSTDEKYFIDHEGNIIKTKPNIIKKENRENIEISVEARNMTETRQILSGLARSYKNINVEEVLANVEQIEEDINENLHINLDLGGNDVLPAILKMAINYYIYKMGDVNSVSHAINDLKIGKTSRVSLIFLRKRVFDIDEGEVSHSIFMIGSKDEKKIYAIIELFNSVKFLVRLSENYELDYFEYLYVYDVLLCREISKEIKCRLPFEFVFNFDYSISKPSFETANKDISRVIGIAMQRQHEVHRKKLIKKAWAETIGKMIPDGEMITEEAVKMFSENLKKQLMEYVNKIHNKNI
jgi:hypothetical protein